MPSLSEPYLAALRQLATDAGYGPRELQRRSGLPFTTVHHFLVGDHPTMDLETALALAGALGASLILKRGRLRLVG